MKAASDVNSRRARPTVRVELPGPIRLQVEPAGEVDDLDALQLGRGEQGIDRERELASGPVPATLLGNLARRREHGSEQIVELELLAVELDREITQAKDERDRGRAEQVGGLDHLTQPPVRISESMVCELSPGRIFVDRELAQLRRTTDRRELGDQSARDVLAHSFASSKSSLFSIRKTVRFIDSSRRTSSSVLVISSLASR
jgi:hypothetical protein